jgi:hypothetical protein
MTRRYSIILGMAAIFREAAPYSGVGENLPTTGQGIVVPSGGSTLVILEDGGGLDVRSTMRSKVYVYEFDVFSGSADLSVRGNRNDGSSQSHVVGYSCRQMGWPSLVCHPGEQ